LYDVYKDDGGGKGGFRVATHVFTQNKGYFQDSPLEGSSPTAGSGTGPSSTIRAGQFDYILIQALA